MMDISTILMVRRSGANVRAALANLREAAGLAAGHGIAVEMIVVLPFGVEAGDGCLEQLLGVRVIRMQGGGMAACRNAAVSAASGIFLAFIDCDDLWGTEWLRPAYTAALAATSQTVWHPEVVVRHSAGKAAEWVSHPDIDTRQGDWVSLAMRDHWTGSSFAARDIHLAVPYQTDVEAWNWAWNAAVVCAGCAHLAVGGTAHLLRDPVTQAGLAPASIGLWRDRIGWRARASQPDRVAP